MTTKLFALEADLVAAFCAEVEGLNTVERMRTHWRCWTAYHETAGFDLLLVADDGTQVGIEAKLVLNAKVLAQALPSLYGDKAGPDYRAVLVPEGKTQLSVDTLAKHLGITVIEFGSRIWPPLPTRQESPSFSAWRPWYPEDRCRLPDYVPDVIGGHASPVTLSEWKIKAIKLLILLDRHGLVTRHDMRLLGISPTRWTVAGHGYLTPGDGGYVRCGRTPDFRAQHPTNAAQIEADFETWGKDHPPPLKALPGLL